MLVGCGARSQLGAPDKERDVTGPGSGGGGATGGSGGQGGRPLGRCENLAARDVVRSFDALTPGAFGHQPRLAATSADGLRVTLVAREQPDPVPIDGTPELVQVTFEPWPSWPATPLGTALHLAPAYDFVLSRQPEEGLTVWLYASTFVTGPQMVLLNAAPTNIDGPASTVGLPMLLGEPRFVTTEASGKRALGSTVGSGVSHAAVSLATKSGTEAAFVSLGCVPGSMPMDGLRVQSRLLTAYVDSAASDCSPGTFMKVVRYTPGSFVFDDLMSQDLGASPTQLQLVPRGEGAWLVWQIDDGVTSGPLEAMKLDSDGLPEGGVISLVQSGAVFEKVALAALGDGLALAYTDSFDPSTPTIVVEVFDADGVQTAATSLTPVAWPRVGEGYGLVGSPSADALLLSWASAEVDPNVEGSARVFTARLDCSRGDPSL